MRWTAESEAMYETKTANVKLTWWPTPQDYNEAVQIPQANLQDSELKTGLIYTDALGLPRPVTGSFASVYRMHCQDRDYALRLFLREIADQEARYTLISDFVQHDDLPYTVTFDFLKQGIKVVGRWLPSLKMEWVEGTQLDDYIEQNLGNSRKLELLADQFFKMMRELHRAGIAHGDLQHGNIIVCNDELRLVDYDGMYVPLMKGALANELGHRNYQHPGRNHKHFGPSLDNFSAWVIYTSLRAVQSDSRLMHQLGGGDDCLLFKEADFLDPLHSPAFAALEASSNDSIKNLARFVRGQLKNDPANVPFLDGQLPKLQVPLEPLSPSASVLRQGPRLERGSLPDWLKHEIVKALAGEPSHATAGGAAAKPKLQSWVVPSKPATATAQWQKPRIQIQSQTRGLPIPAGLMAPTPRTVEFDDNSGRVRPQVFQWLMVLNPIVWFMISMLIQVCGPDQALRVDGVDYPGNVAQVLHFSGKSPSTVVTYNFVVNDFRRAAVETLSGDIDVKKGQSVTVHALPSDPTRYEPVGHPPGSKQAGDLWRFLLGALATFICEVGIWGPALKQKRFARDGRGVVGKITAMRTEIKPKGEKVHLVTVSYDLSNHHFVKEIPVREGDYASLKIGAQEVLLCDNGNPHEVMFYRFCAYKPVGGSAAQVVSAASTVQTRP